MALVNYATGISSVSGALSKPVRKKINGKKVVVHSHDNYLVGTHRVAETQNPECLRLFIKKSDAYKRSTPLSQREQQARVRFAAVRAAVKARKADLTKVTNDQMAYLEQKDLPNGKTTLEAYYWKICGDEYDAQH